MLSVLQGRASVTVSGGGSGEQVIELSAAPDPHAADYVYVPPLHWLSVGNFSSDAVVLLLGSEPFDEAEFVRDRAELERLTAAAAAAATAVDD